MLAASNLTFPAEVASIVFSPRPPVNPSVLNLVPDHYDYQQEKKTLNRNKVFQHKDEVVFGVDPWLNKADEAGLGERGIRKRRKHHQWNQREDNFFSQRKVNNNLNQDVNMYEGMVESEKSTSKILRQGAMPKRKKLYKPRPMDAKKQPEFYGSSPGSGSYSTYYFEKNPADKLQLKSGEKLEVKENSFGSSFGFFKALGNFFNFNIWGKPDHKPDVLEEKIDNEPTEVTFGNNTYVEY